MKKLPLGIQTFKKIVESNCVYADKTEYIYNLIEDASCYFLSRPRRFGKSLLLDTIGEVFLGNKELFKGLFIYTSDYDFAPHPVIRLDMSNIANDTPESLNHSTLSRLKHIYDTEGFNFNETKASDAFVNLIILLNQKHGAKVVVLIDEYDKPLLDHLHEPESAEANRRVMRKFYGILKSMDAYLRFTFITGVSKFSKTSIFSGLNHLRDITMTKKYACICGIPVTDLDKYFGEHIESLKNLNIFSDIDNMHDAILSWYDGYSWDGVNRVINPFALLNFLMEERFGNFWYATGSPKFLIDMIKDRPEYFMRIKNLALTNESLDAFDIGQMYIESILFQTGYLTVEYITAEEGIPAYHLKIPNREVKNAFNLQVLSGLTESGDVLTGITGREIKIALNKGDMQKMLEMLRGLFASIPYELHISKEAYYHTVFYAVMLVLGFEVAAEVSTSRGRVDAVLELSDKVYVIEFKYENIAGDATEEEKQAVYNKTLDTAMAQIKDKGYHEKYIGLGKTIHLAAFAFLGRDEIEMCSETM